MLYCETTHLGLSDDIRRSDHTI